jgi:4-deoxy-L-threo-5-hexosulose-uronate ketol-isomerase
MKVCYSVSPEQAKRMTTEETRKTFLIDSLFQEDAVEMIYSEIDRAIVGSAVPNHSSLLLEANKKEMAAEYFAERREIGVINLGEKGKVTLDANEYILEREDMLYIGRGVKSIKFEKIADGKIPLFYFASYPAHKEYPSKLIKKSEAVKANLGSSKEANVRTINKYILPAKLESCQLVMGMTELAEGSVWNTMPVHTHQRRSEIYLYFNIQEDAVVMHLMGAPDETRHIVIRNLQAVASPIWSIHSGCGTKNYSFVWAMGGENQDFDDMDGVEMKSIK